MVHLGYGKWTKKKNVTPQTWGENIEEVLNNFPHHLQCTLFIYTTRRRRLIFLLLLKKKEVSEKKYDDENMNLLYLKY